MDHLINNIIDEEEIFNLMFEKGAFIDYQYFYTCIVIFAGYLVIYYLVLLYYSKKF